MLSNETIDRLNDLLANLWRRRMPEADLQHSLLLEGITLDQDGRLLSEPEAEAWLDLVLGCNVEGRATRRESQDEY